MPKTVKINNYVQDDFQKRANKKITYNSKNFFKSINSWCCIIHSPHEFINIRVKMDSIAFIHVLELSITLSPHSLIQIIKLFLNFKNLINFHEIFNTFAFINAISRIRIYKIKWMINSLMLEIKKIRYFIVRWPRIWMNQWPLITMIINDW